MRSTPDIGRRPQTPTQFRTRTAIHGRGKLLIGPDDHSHGPGALVFAPPGVLLRNSEGGPPLTRDGWRKARWAADADGHVLIDQTRPVDSMKVALGEVVEDVATRSPEHLAWVATVVERQLRLALGRMGARDHAGRMDPRAAAARTELVRLRKEADTAFRRAALICDDDAPYLRIGYFTNLVSGGYLAWIEGRQRIAAAQRLPGEPYPPGRHSTLRPRFRDDEDDRPRPKPVD